MDFHVIVSLQEKESRPEIGILADEGTSDLLLILKGGNE